MDDRRKRFLIASALFGYINNEVGKPFELQRHGDVEDMQEIFAENYSEFLDVLEQRKAMGHNNLSHTIRPITENSD